VLWFRLSRDPLSDGAQTGGYVRRGLFLVTINRDTYWQCAYVIPKGSLEALRARGLEALKSSIAEAAPFLQDSLAELNGWDALKLLTVQVDRMPRWYRKGLLCIGDAAHAMSPVGGVGINLAVQDAVAATNILWQPLRQRSVSVMDLAKVQQRREWPTKMMQRVQLFVQKRIISNVLAMTERPRPPFVVTLFNRFPVLRRIPARLIGMGFRPEHVQSPELPPRHART
jgi:2-polyprenyl-6-methoxyphenol hydroxylase-like FAD-dependent oxidoreductase